MHEMDGDRLAELLDQHGPALVLYARQWCDAAEDVVQEAFLRLMRQRPVPAHVVGWLYRVVRNRAISAVRESGRRTRHERRAAVGARSWFASTDSDPLDVDEVSEALNQLPLRQREVLVARLWGGLSFDEVARLAGVSSSTAHRRYGEALEALRRRLGVSLTEKVR